MSEFTRNEVNLIFDGLDAILQRDSQNVFIRGFFQAMSPTPEEQLMSQEELTKHMEHKMKKDHDEIEKTQKMLKDRIILLKAKLIQIRDKIEVDSIINSTNKDK